MLMVCNFGRGGANAGGRHDGGMTLEEYRTSLSLYAVLASPIIISADLRSVASEHAECLAMLKNEEVIAISQDPLGAAGRLVSQATNVSGDPSSRTAARHNNIVEQVFARELSGGARVCAVSIVCSRCRPLVTAPGLGECHHGVHVRDEAAWRGWHRWVPGAVGPA
eukprot:COSAG01_NODE_20691_length_940_cov_0.774078_2_plen_165_part_01